MEENIKIQEATTDDFHAIAMIYNEYILLGNATMDETLKKADDIAAWVQKFNSRERLYCIKEEKTTIGWGIIKRYSDREGYRFACETAVYLTANQLGKGYGSLMKKYLITQCKELDYKHLIAKIFATNKGSIVYNQKLGYTIVGTQKQIGFKNNQWQDIVIMQYLIS